MLQGIRILDLTWVLGGPFASMLLAELGAEVVKIEPPSGDLARRFPPYYFEGDSSFYLSVNRGKESVVLDLKQPGGMAAFRDLVTQSDAVMYGFTPEVPKRLGIDFDSLCAINPRICLAELIGLHDAEPYASAPSFDIIAQALGGVMSITGETNGAPNRVGYQVADLAGGLYLALGLASALVNAVRSGKGSRVQVSLLDCQLALLTWQAQNYFVAGQIPGPTGTRHPMVAPSEVFVCSDGARVAISGTTPQQWAGLCRCIERPDLEQDERFADTARRCTNMLELSALLAVEFLKHPAAVWEQRLFAERVPVGRVNNVAQALEQPLAALRKMVEHVAHPISGEKLGFVGSAFKFAGRRSLGYPPAHGAHTHAVLQRICRYDEQRMNELCGQGGIGLATAKASDG